MRFPVLDRPGKAPSVLLLLCHPLSFSVPGCKSELGVVSLNHFGAVDAIPGQVIFAGLLNNDVEATCSQGCWLGVTEHHNGKSNQSILVPGSQIREVAPLTPSLSRVVPLDVAWLTRELVGTRSWEERSKVTSPSMTTSTWTRFRKEFPTPSQIVKL